MATYTRNNAWNKGGTLTNLDLLWYAKGVGKMMTRALNDPASWWFFGAIHGEYVNPNTAWYPNPPAFPAWKFIKPPPAVPTTPLPTKAIQDLYWNQCQHQSWFFLPWHRGYLLALEAQLRKDIVSLGGPSSWALPYWNYFGGTNGSQYQMPPAFAAKKLPDNTANPLFFTMRYGPDGNGNIFIPTAAGEAAHPGDPNFSRGEVNANAMKNDLFTGSDQITKPPGFGGPETGFHHSDGTSGNWESNPHNLVHVYTGYYGAITFPLYGLMSDPGTASLDPIFYLHHANIDRMWAIWNASGNANPTKSNWLKGPTPRKFVMPGTNGQPWYYTPQQMGNLASLNYTYQELKALAAPKMAALPKRLMLLGAKDAAAKAKKEDAAPAKPKKTELMGASEGSLKIKGRISLTTVKLDPQVRNKTMRSLAKAAENAAPDNVYLKVENVRGTFDAAVLSVYVNLPDKAKPRESDQYLAGNVALFGLRRASIKDGQHAGEGLTFILDVTPVIDALHLSHSLDVDSLRVSVIPADELPEKADITIGRISLYREGF
jgi:tyrosinase